MSNKNVKKGLVFFSEKTAPQSKKRSIFWFIYFLICALAQVWPLYLIANRTDPYVFGMPFSMFWVALWIAIIFIGTLSKYRQEYRR